MQKDIGFLLNHYSVHQVPHIVPYAFELSRLHEDARVQILCSTEAEAAFAERIGRTYEGHRCSIELLDLPLWARVVEPVASKIFFARKNIILAHHAARLARLDVLVVPEMTSVALKRRADFSNVKMVFTMHGAGDRAGCPFDERLRMFDLVLMPGRKYAEALVDGGVADAEKSVLAGYPKFEAMDRIGVQRRKFFDNDRPVVVYNPHHYAKQSSWPKFGRQVLDYFYQSADYNLIFAPHTLLFKRSWGKGQRFPGKYKPADNVLIDLGSMASSDLTYMRSADIYLGDVSSQVYEFLEQPRPCVFLDAHDAQWEGNPFYRSWTFGPVIDDPAMLHEALLKAREEHARYLPKQVEGFDYTFEKSGTSAAVRGARAIARLAGLE